MTIKTYEDSILNIVAIRTGDGGQLRYELRMVAIMADNEVRMLKSEIERLKNG